MIDRLPGLDGLIAIRKAVVRTRPETIQEREDALNNIFQQMGREEVGSERHYNFFSAYTWLKGREERTIVEVFGKPLPVWL